jgi:hypothetical protein
VPFGNDLFAKYGNQKAVPLVGNFDPPVASAPAAPAKKAKGKKAKAAAAAALANANSSANTAAPTPAPVKRLGKPTTEAEVAAYFSAMTRKLEDRDFVTSSVNVDEIASLLLSDLQL